MITTELEEYKGPIVDTQAHFWDVSGLGLRFTTELCMVNRWVPICCKTS